ncbi:MAG: hypothetical protein ACI9JD_001255 [Rhodococcus sp. (in: high G+C Gram-positive bacteria)]|jgi:hypothetical protein
MPLPTPFGEVRLWPPRHRVSVPESPASALPLDWDRNPANGATAHGSGVHLATLHGRSKFDVLCAGEYTRENPTKCPTEVVEAQP